VNEADDTKGRTMTLKTTIGDLFLADGSLVGPVHCHYEHHDGVVSAPHVDLSALDLLVLPDDQHMTLKTDDGFIDIRIPSSRTRQERDGQTGDWKDIEGWYRVAIVGEPRFRLTQ
jgi:hypothetical protein